MDAGTRKSSVFTALTQPVAEFERQQAAAALPSITETAVLRRIADQAAAHAEAAASKASVDQQEERQAEAIARAAEAANLVVPPVPRWLVDDATPEALAGLLATYGRIALLSPEGDVFDQMAGRYNQTAGPNLGVYLKGHAGDLLKVDRRGRPPEYVERPCLTIGLAVQPEVLRGPAGQGSAAAACWPGSSTASRPVWSAAGRSAPHPSQRRWPTATPWNSKPWPPA
jgi:replicative DNA helicase